MKLRTMDVCEGQGLATVVKTQDFLVDKLGELDIDDISAHMPSKEDWQEMLQRFMPGDKVKILFGVVKS